MKLARLFGLAVLLAGTLSAVFADDGETPKWVKVNKQLENVYSRLNSPNPREDIIRQVRKNEYLELISIGEGGSWYKVRIDGREGFLEARSGTVVTRKGVPAIMILLYIVLLLGCAAGVVLYVKKQQGGTASPAFDPDSD
jgi:hypothetical protein